MSSHISFSDSLCDLIRSAGAVTCSKTSRVIGLLLSVDSDVRPIHLVTCQKGGRGDGAAQTEHTSYRNLAAICQLDPINF